MSTVIFVGIYYVVLFISALFNEKILIKKIIFLASTLLSQLHQKHPQVAC